MAPSLKHKFTSAKADGADVTVVRPSDWNDEHDLVFSAAGKVLGRDTSGAGAAQELPIAVTPAGDVSFPSARGYLAPPSGTTAQRPSAPISGMVRYNETLGQLEVYGAGGSASWQSIVVGDSIVPVGATIGWYTNTLPAGRWLFANGRTIGDATSAATALASAEAHALFLVLWALPDLFCPVTPGGRGASAEADWAAHKKIGLPDECGRVAAGADNMGGITTKGRLNATGLGVLAVPGAVGGSQTHTQTIAEMPAHTHTQFGNQSASNSVGGPVLGGGPDEATGSTGGGDPFTIVQPTVIRNVLIRY